MAKQEITKADLQEFKCDLLQDIKLLLSNKNPISDIKQLLRSSDVMDLLGITSVTLMNLRSNGTIPYTKVGRIIYYELQDIQNIIDDNRIDNQN
ncbi:helix-turn-helix domain-containing protein [Formosa haliotis]|uniref:helix-turn-helix domain-containing protein n=1 Tax=Formosa haliotis TaxID=1555194 RepID=UPI00082707BB|nr:helix-turn-helix domain-containing protein [Formosa haliotis]